MDTDKHPVVEAGTAGESRNFSAERKKLRTNQAEQLTSGEGSSKALDWARPKRRRAVQARSTWLNSQKPGSEGEQRKPREQQGQEQRRREFPEGEIRVSEGKSGRKHLCCCDSSNSLQLVGSVVEGSEAERNCWGQKTFKTLRDPRLQDQAELWNKRQKDKEFSKGKLLSKVPSGGEIVDKFYALKPEGVCPSFKSQVRQNGGSCFQQGEGLNNSEYSYKLAEVPSQEGADIHAFKSLFKDSPRTAKYLSTAPTCRERWRDNVSSTLNVCFPDTNKYVNQPEIKSLSKQLLTGEKGHQLSEGKSPAESLLQEFREFLERKASFNYSVPEPVAGYEERMPFPNSLPSTEEDTLMDCSTCLIEKDN